MASTFRVLSVAAMLLSSLAVVQAEDAEAIAPKDGVIRLFNGKDLDGLYPWISDTKYEDPRHIFTVENGMLHISGNGIGYICTKGRYKDYHLVCEYRWGDKTWAPREKAARDTGIIIHCADPDGSYGGAYMAGIEAQIINGGTGDLLVLPGKKADGADIPVTMTAETSKDRDGEDIWTPGAPKQVINTTTRVNFFGRDPDWADKIDYRGPKDVDSPGKEWTRLEVICDGGHLKYFVNGVLANEGFDVSPASGKILIQTEMAEVFVRRFELYPLGVKPEEIGK